MYHVATINAFPNKFGTFSGATGAPKRLNRDHKGRFGDKDYAFEELVAELTSAFLSAEFAIDNDIQQSAAYISGWIKLLTDHAGAMVTAASLASRAVEFIRELALPAASEPQETDEFALAA